MNKERIREVIEFAREQGLSTVEVDGIKFEIPKAEAAKPDVKPMTEEEIKKVFNPLDQMDDEDVLYWATPYYDELQAQKKQRAEQLKQERDLNGKN